jgi:hypothetical protein
MRHVLNNRFLPMFGLTGDSVEFDFEDPTPSDREQDSTELMAKAAAAEKLASSGWDPADILKTVGLPPMKFQKPPELAPRPALPGGSQPDQPSDQEARAVARAIRQAFRPGDDDRDYEHLAAMLLAELPHRNGHRKELV